ncbi:uncharacterized protein LOC127843180 [Dreissena polymorpha]|uniref:uncharacterized protein LOC127843180 n=1 Tax=Dreissena polymorpha TaxID=45954 RepID=UPI002263D53D|nr:uncharacterized protein LOC127843180 [Dreissena polymorpha]
MRCRHYDTSDDDMDVDKVVHVLRVPDAPTGIEATQAARLLHEESGSGDTMDAVGADHSTSMFDVSRPERSMKSKKKMRLTSTMKPSTMSYTYRVHEHLHTLWWMVVPRKVRGS